jgi:hypothetical protein
MDKNIVLSETSRPQNRDDLCVRLAYFEYYHDLNHAHIIPSQCTLHAGLSYRASGGLLAGEPGRRAGGPVHYALYEPGGVL